MARNGLSDCQRSSAIYFEEVFSISYCCAAAGDRLPQRGSETAPALEYDSKSLPYNRQVQVVKRVGLKSAIELLTLIEEKIISTHPRTLSHIGISVLDVEKVAKFYSDVMGW
ncbi:MAG: hypothetical protein ACJAQ6_001325 [Arenicella sp.]